MVIVTCSNASDRIRGELTRFLFEIEAGVYVGNISASVREVLFEKIQRLSFDLGAFRAVMIYSYKNEVGFKYEYINCGNYKLKDFDGVYIPAFNLEK